MMPFPACASNQKNRTFGPKNGDRSAKKASGHRAESENILFIVDLRNCQCDRPCKTRDGARGTAHRTGIRARGIGVNPYTAPSIARIFQQLDDLRPLPFEQLEREFPKAESSQPRAKRFDLWRANRRWISGCRKQRGEMRSMIWG